MPSSPLLAVRQLVVSYALPAAWPWQTAPQHRAVDGVDFDLRAGETLGVVGESGCGKSSLARALIGLQPVGAGSIQYAGRELAMLDSAQWRPLRREIQMVFQDPLSSLNPRMTVGESIAEPLRSLMPEISPAGRSSRVGELMERVGLAAVLRNRYPHELSGGQCQRAGIARALSVRPRLLICDEPVSALDVSVQAQVVNLLARLQREENLSMIFIAHDLAIVRHLSQRVLVMQAGKVVEQSACEEIFARPAHPYTQSLLGAALAL